MGPESEQIMTGRKSYGRLGGPNKFFFFKFFEGFSKQLFGKIHLANIVDIVRCGKRKYCDVQNLNNKALIVLI